MDFQLFLKKIRTGWVTLMNVIKRSGEEVSFDAEKIIVAIRKANNATRNTKQITDDEITDIANQVIAQCNAIQRSISVEEIQDLVENQLMAAGAYTVAHNYITYRYERALVRKANTTDKKILSLLGNTNEEAKQENSNKNPTVNSTQRDYMAGEVSKDITRRFLLPADIWDAHEKGIIHFHDADYFAQPMYNCCLVNLEDMLQNGTVISGTKIDKPHSFATACNIATQIIAQVASNQYGGQTITLSHLAPFVDISRQKYRKAVAEEMEAAGVDVSQEKIDRIAEERVRREIMTGVQTIQYQIITLMTTNGQAPFVTVFMYLDEVEEGRTRDDLALIIEEMLKQRMVGVKNEKGVYITPAFPKLIYALDEDNIHEDSKYYYLTKLAAECTAKRMVPDYISAKIMKELKGDVYPCMGCRSFLTPDRFTENDIGNIANAKNYEPNKHKYYGRFNQGVVTISLPDIAFSSDGDFDKFWELFEERTELCHKALRARHDRLLGTLSDVAPILWQHGALARLNKHEEIDKLLYNGYSTISLGYAGLYECVKYMTKHSHSDEGIGEEFGLKVMQSLNDKCAQWKQAENIDYSLYGTPLESTTYKFAKCLKNRFGDNIFVELDGRDRNYITNSYHIPVFEPIDAFEKLRIESKFQQLSPGGAISYIETPSMSHNIPALLEVIKYMYEHIMYAEINTKSCYCEKCGYSGDIPLVDENGTLKWECPNCGNDDNTTMDIAFRVCGYIGTAKNGGNQGRYGDIHDRVYHLDDIEYEGCDA